MSLCIDVLIIVHRLLHEDRVNRLNQEFESAARWDHDRVIFRKVCGRYNRFNWRYCNGEYVGVFNCSYYICVGPIPKNYNYSSQINSIIK